MTASRQGTYACLLLGIIYCAIYIVIARFGTQYLVLLFMNADERRACWTTRSV